LAAGIAGLAKSPSQFAGLLRKDAVYNGLGHVKLPEELAKALNTAFDSVRTEALGHIGDAGKKQQAEALFNALAPTIKAADLDGAVVVTNKGKQFTALGAFKVERGDELGKVARALLADTVKDLPPAIKEKIKLDFDAVGATKIHKFEFSAEDDAGKMLEMYLGGLTVYLAFCNDGVLLSVGSDGLKAIKDAIAVPRAATGPVVFQELDVARLAPVLPPAQANKVKQLFPNGQGGIIRFTVEGGAAVTVRLNTSVAVLQLLGHLRELHDRPN
jgi:hypothetical protein